MAHRYIGKNIYELRKKRGWSQSDLAHKLDKKASTISSYETDSKTPSVDTIIAMSEPVSYTHLPGRSAREAASVPASANTASQQYQRSLRAARKHKSCC